MVCLSQVGSVGPPPRLLVQGRGLEPVDSLGLVTTFHSHLRRPPDSPSPEGPSPEGLIVDLRGTDGDGVFPVGCFLLHLREEQPQGPLVDAWVLRGPLRVKLRSQ